MSLAARLFFALMQMDRAWTSTNRHTAGVLAEG